MALTRSIYSQFEAWKEAPRHGALLVAGARQVGKTFLIRQFARENYEVLLEINFVETPSAKSIFEGDLDAETLIANLTAFSGTALKPGGTLVFLDEVQECPKARTAIKFLVDDGALRLHRVGVAPRRAFRRGSLASGGLRADAADAPLVAYGVLSGKRRPARNARPRSPVLRGGPAGSDGRP